jgi:peptide/nickel transport system substrate-binding protein
MFKNRIIFICAWFSFLVGVNTSAETLTFRAFISSVHPNSLYPFDNSDGITSNQLNQIFETLTSYNNEGKLIPLLATHWHWIDNKTLELKLREGVLFHNQEPFDSEAVKFTFDQFLNPTVLIANRQYADSISGVEVVDPYRVRIKTKQPDSFLIDRLATVGHILPPKYFLKVGKNEFSKKPVGTGPFQLVSTDFKSKMLLEKNKHYWGPLPVIDQLEFDYLPSFEKAIELFKKKKLDFISHLPGGLINQVLNLNEVSITKRLTNQSIMVLVNTIKKPSPLRNRAFRKALWESLDFNEVIKYYDLGNGSPTTSLSLPGEPFFDSKLPQVIPSFKKKKILLDAKPYVFRMQVTEPLKVMGEIIAKQMRDAGLSVEVKYGSNMDEVKEVLDYKVKGLVPEIDFLVSHCAHLFPAFPHLILLPSSGNWSLTSDSFLDQMLKNVTSEFDEKKQKEIFFRINRYVYDNAILFPGFQFKDIYVYGNQYEFIPHPSAYIFFKYLKLKEKKSVVPNK